jgi:hypothetical protein
VFSPRQKTWLRSLIILGVVGLAALAVLYWSFGERLGMAIYDGKISHLPGSLLAGCEGRTAAEFQSWLDGLFWQRLIIGIPLTILFYFGLFKVVLALVRRQDSAALTDLLGSPRLLRCDWLIALLVYSLLALAAFWPALSSFSTHLFGPAEDNQQFLWNMWWVKRVLFEGQGSLIFANMMYAPQGASLLYHSMTLANTVPAALLLQFLTDASTSNLLYLSSFPLSGLGAFLLVRYLLRNSWLALLGGFIFAFSPWHFVQSLHHLNLAAIQWLPFFVLFYIRAISERKARHLFWSALFLALAALCSWNYLIFCCYFMLLGYLYLALRARRLWLPEVFGRTVAITALSLLVLSPWLVPMILAGLRHGGVPALGHNWMVADLAGSVIPHAYHLLGSWQPFKSITATYTGNPWEATSYLGVFALLMVLLNLRALSTAAAKYLLGGLSALVLAWGAHPHLVGWSIPIILPYRIIEYLPFLSNIRAPGRHIVFVYLFLAILIPLALKLLYNRMGSGALSRCGMIAIVLLLIFDYTQVCTETTSTAVPVCYERLKDDKGAFAILDLPLGYKRTNRYLMYQTGHELPIVEGWTARKLEPTLVDSLDLADVSHLRDQLRRSGVKYVVVHKQSVREGRPPHLQEYLNWFRLVYVDESNLIWQTYEKTDQLNRIPTLRLPSGAVSLSSQEDDRQQAGTSGKTARRLY